MVTNTTNPLSMIDTILARLEQPPQPHGIFQSRIALGTTAFFIAAYYMIAPHFPKAKQKSWVISSVVSLMMSVSSLPYFVHVLKSGGVFGLTFMPSFTYAVCRTFQGFMIADLAMCVLYYRSEMDLISGWLHHGVYLWSLNVVIEHGWTHIFTLACILEVPTFILATAILFPVLRNNTFFAVVFFMLRIVFNLYLLIQLSLPEQRAESTGGSFGPAIMLTGALAMHLMWFRGLLLGFIKRAKQRAVVATGHSNAKKDVGMNGAVNTELTNGNANGLHAH